MKQTLKLKRREAELLAHLIHDVAEGRITRLEYVEGYSPAVPTPLTRKLAKRIDERIECDPFADWSEYFDEAPARG